MLREQAEVIKQQRDLENEIAMLKNQVLQAFLYTYIQYVLTYIHTHYTYMHNMLWSGRREGDSRNPGHQAERGGVESYRRQSRAGSATERGMSFYFHTYIHIHTHTYKC